jgi:hypothetical protein
VDQVVHAEKMMLRIVTAIRGNIIAWLALFVAMGGTSLAASHYIITSTKQIKPSVLKQLRGQRGVKGTAGSTGLQGLPGLQGKEGSAGKEGATGKEGHTVTEVRFEKEGREGKEGKAGAQGREGIEGREGKEGKQGEKGEKGEKGENGEKGEKGEEGHSALAFAHITSAGKVEPEADSKNFTGATVIKPESAQHKPEPGVFCISGLSLTPHSVVATVDANESVIPMIAATVGAGAESKCPGATQVTVETWVPVLVGSEVEAETSDEGFYLEIN